MILYDLSYIHLHSSLSTGILRTQNVTSSQWIDSSVGRALHRYRRGHGFESRSGLNFFSGFNFTLPLLYLDHTMIYLGGYNREAICL